MKKALLVVVVLALLLAGGILFFLGQREAADGAAMVPADTILFAEVPDMARTSQRWPETALAQIGAEPGVADFLAKPLATLGTGGVTEASEILSRLKPGLFFVALTGIEENSADVVVGFRYSGTRADLDAAMARLHDHLSSLMPGGTRAEVDYEGNAVTSFAGGSVQVFSASHGEWGFVSTSGGAIRECLDRASGRNSSDSLASNASFKKVAARLPREPDFFWYGAVGPIVDILEAVGLAQGAQANTAQFSELRKIQAAGGTLLFDGADQKEVSFLLMEDMPKVPALSHAMMDLTTPETTIFFESSLDLETLSSPGYAASFPEPMQAFLSELAVDNTNISDILGGEMGLALKWSPGAMIPSLLVGLTIKDRARIEQIVTTAFAKSGMEMTVSEGDGAKVFVFPPLGLPIVNPAIAIDDRFLLGSLTTAELQRAIARKEGEGTLKSAEVFESALPAFEANDQAFAFIDTKVIFENLYNQLRPILILTASVSPQIGGMIDAEKLPETEQISRHLSPIVYVNRQVADGWIVESSGPITFSQAAALLGIGIGASVAAQMGAMSQ